MNFFKTIMNPHTFVAAIVSVAGIVDCSAYNVGTLAGSAPSGYTEGTGTAAKFNNPRGMIIDGNGNLYIADKNNHCIRKITPQGVVSTFAGSSSAGYADGAGTAAQFNKPYGLAIDKDSNIYVSDKGNHRIRKITPQGAVSTIIGSGTAGLVNAAGTAAQFNSPSAIALDGNGNLFVVDTLNHCIRKVSPQGIVTTVAGSGVAGYIDSTGTAAQFNKPVGITFDTAGNLYVTDEGNNNIRKITPQGVVTTLAGLSVGGYVNGAGVTAQFNSPAFITIDNQGILYVADKSNNRIRQVTTNFGVVTTFAGGATAGYTDAVAESALFNGPTGIITDKNGVFYIADNDIIRKVVPSGYY